MTNTHSLKDVAKYAEDKTSSSAISIDSYISTDNLLPNKAGIKDAVNLPPSSFNLPAYKCGDILIGNIRPYLKKIWFSNRDGGCSADVLVLRAKENTYPKFLYYALFRDDFFAHAMRGAKGTKMPRGDKAQILEFSIPKFSAKRQEEIANVLTAIDSKIDCNNRLNAELEEMAMMFYDYWFLQFDFPDDKSMPYKSSGGKMIYSDILKREIPLGWGCAAIGDIFSTHLGGTPSRHIDEYWAPGEVNWLSSGENPSTFVVTPDEKISKIGLQNSPAKLLPRGTVILSIVRHLRASILGIESATNQSVVGIMETAKFKHSFIYPYLIREIPRLMGLRTGAQQPHINKSVLDESILVIPDDLTLSKYTAKVAPIFLKIHNNLEQNIELSKLRDWLLPLLMNGQVVP